MRNLTLSDFCNLLNPLMVACSLLPLKRCAKRFGSLLWFFPGFVVLCFLLLLLHQRLLFHLIADNAAVGRGAFFSRLPPTEVWVASHCSCKVRSFSPAPLSCPLTAHITHGLQHIRGITRWQHQLPTIILLKSLFSFLHVAALTSKTL